MSQFNANSTPPSPRRSWMKISALDRARSVENMHPLGEMHPASPASKSPPLTLAKSPKDDGKKIPISPLDTPPKKMWESGFKSFLSRRGQPQSTTAFPEVPLMAPTHRETVSNLANGQPQSSPSGKNGRKSGDQSVRGGKIFQSIFGDHQGHRKRRGRRILVPSSLRH